nr:hypothetical protein [Tanacetum cinerariifolium]
MECKVDTLMKEAISLMGRSKSVFGTTSNTMYQLPSEPSRQEEFKDLVMNFILDQEEKVRQLEEYMCVIRSDFMQLSLEVVGKLRNDIRIRRKSRRSQVIPTLRIWHPLMIINSQKLLRKSPPLVRGSTFGFKPGTKNNQNIKSRHDAENLSPQSSLQVLPSFEHDIPLSSREVLIFYEPEPQPNPLPNYPSLDVNLGKERGAKPPIKPLSPNSFRMKVVDLLTIHTPLSPHLASFHLRDLYCYHHPCIDDPKKHYGFKLGLLGHSGSLGVDFSK